MEMHRIVLYVYDFEAHGVEDVKVMLDNDVDLISRVGETSTIDISEWDDDHVLNQIATPSSVFEEHFA